MWGTSYGSVRIGTKPVDLWGFTGMVGDKSTSSETVTTVHDDRNYSSSTTYNYVSYSIRNASGDSADVNAESRHASAHEGDVVSAFWCEVRGKAVGTLAYYNHNRDKLGIVAQIRNDVAGPMGYNWLIVFALFLALFGVMNIVTGDGTSWYIYLAICAGSFYWIIKRRKKLLSLLDSAVEKSRSEAATIKALSAVVLKS